MAISLPDIQNTNAPAVHRVELTGGWITSVQDGAIRLHGQNAPFFLSQNLGDENSFMPTSSTAEPSNFNISKGLRRFSVKVWADDPTILQSGTLGWNMAASVKVTDSALEHSGSEMAKNERIFDDIQTFYLSRNMPRDRQIAERLTTLHQDAIADDESILLESLSQFREFFLRHNQLSIPKITLTPDGTLRVRWIQGPTNFFAIEFIGTPLVKLVAEIPRDDGLTARYFCNESINKVITFANAIGALL